MNASDLFRQFLDAGMQFTQLTQQRAEAIVRDLVRTGEVQTEQAQSMVNEFVDRSRENTEKFFELVRAEIQQQLKALGVVTKSDLARAQRAGSGAAASAAGTASATKSTAKKSTAQKSTAKKSTAKKTTAKKTPASKSTARKSTAKRTPAKKTPAKKSSTTARKASSTAKKASSSGSSSGS